MKKTILFVLLAVATLSCNKDKVSANDPIIGNWHLVTMSNMRGVFSQAEWGHTQSYTFNSNSTCSKTLDEHTTTAKFKLKNIYSDVYQKDMPFLQIKDQPECMVLYIHDTLLLSYHPELDGNVDAYVKD